MNKQFLKIKNFQGEKLDVLIEGNSDSRKTVVFVHGFGTNKNGGENLFVDISQVLQNDFRIVRFDFSGYGKSEGKSESVDYIKQGEDLITIIKYIRENFEGEIYLIAHSMGTLVTALLCPKGIKKAVFTGIPEEDPLKTLDTIKNRIQAKEKGVFDERGISFYSRSSGEVQKIGCSFWEVLRSIEPVKMFESFSKKTELILFKPQQDEVVGNEFFENCRKSEVLNWVELPGDHNFSTKGDRKELIKRIKEFLD